MRWWVFLALVLVSATARAEYNLGHFSTYEVSQFADAVAIGDVTGDGLDDIVLTTASRADLRVKDNFVYIFVQQADGLIATPQRYTVGTDTFTTGHRSEITSLAARYRLPAVYPYRVFAEFGGLLSYGDDLTDNFRRAASYADRILKGAKPSELPVQAPVKFELVINLKTARALGLDVPLHLQQRADEVIE